MRIPIHREGWPFIGFAAVANLLAYLLAPWAGLVLLPVTLWVVAFFRDPERTAPAGEGLIISPADGKLLPIVQAIPPAELEMGAEPVTRLSIFMNVFNVHVNRAPCEGTVTKLAYRPGKFFNASFDKASTDNERMSMRLRIKKPGGVAETDIAVIQIAGLVARRIVSETSEGQHLCRGDRFGIIRFGSRVDVYLPGAVSVMAKSGQTVRAGGDNPRVVPKLMAKLPKVPKPDMARVANLSETVPVTRHIPSAITLAALCAGATAIPLAMYGNYKGAVAMIVLAALLDTMDGWIARLIGAGSEFGAQLDSLADLVSFGIAPSIVIYMWTLTHAGGAGWVMALIYAMCCAVRLARFNVESVDVDAPPAKHFTGMPTPIAACLILLPMQFTFQFSDPTFRDPMVTAVMIALVSIMMVSRVPTFSLKRLHIPKNRRMALAVLAVPVVASAIIYPWATLATVLIIYFATIPVSVIQFANVARKRRISLRDDDEIDFTP